VLDRVSTSQPLEATPSQSAKPARQLPTAQAPERHTPTALKSEHAAPQDPQWVELVLVFTSQPLEATPSQSAKPALQVKPQAPAEQVAVALALAGQGAPQRPQCCTLVLVFTSQPLTALPSQLPIPATQAPMEHTPAAQVAAALGKAQLRPHAPQCESEALRSVSQPLAAMPSQLS